MGIEVFTRGSAWPVRSLKRLMRRLVSRCGARADLIERDMPSCNMVYAATDEEGNLEGVCLVDSERILHCGGSAGGESIVLGLCASRGSGRPGLMARLYATVWNDAASILEGTGRRIRIGWDPIDSCVSRIVASCADSEDGGADDDGGGSRTIAPPWSFSPYCLVPRGPRLS